MILGASSSVKKLEARAKIKTGEKIRKNSLRTVEEKGVKNMWKNKNRFQKRKKWIEGWRSKFPLKTITIRRRQAIVETPENISRSPKPPTRNGIIHSRSIISRMTINMMKVFLGFVRK